MDGLPHRIECKKDLRTGQVELLADELSIAKGELPHGLEGFVDASRFVRSFSEGADRIVFERELDADLVYHLKKDEIHGDYRILQYTRF